MTRSRDLANLADGVEFLADDHTKLDGIEPSATADQTDAEIRTAVEAASDSNVFTDADHSKLNAVEASADVTDTANVTAAGALMDSEVTNLAQVKAFDATDYATSAQGTLAASAVQPNDSAALKELDLNAIATDISDTAVDVFVYDTSKDSDGGAWRKRTQNTSWYNEALGTATRGSRKEFPAVAVIVAESNKVTIYDGDNPDLPMWMVFNPYDGAGYTGYHFQMAGGSSVSATVALNGTVCITQNSSAYPTPLIEFSFIHDRSKLWTNSGYKYSLTPIQKRNTTGSYPSTFISGGLVNNFSNDVAMTVLPNAPIDYATGLPVPTIAVATSGGVSVIKDDGTVVDITGASSYNYVKYLSFLPDNKLIYTLDYSSYSRFIRVDNIPSADFSATSNSDQVGNSLELYANYPGLGQLNWLSPNTAATNYVCKNNIGSTTGLTILDRNPTSPANGMVAYTTSDYNTGWMNGAIKLATLSDTDDTNVTGAELVTGWVNGSTYAYDTLSTSGSTISSAITDGSNFAGVTSNAMSLTAGKEYTVSFALTINSGAVLTYVFFATAQTGGGSLGLGNYLVNIGTGNHSLTFTAPSTGTFYLTFQAGNGVTTNFTTGAVSVRLAEEDHSVNGNGLQVFGSITKTAVATGADLVAYSGFTASNALIQPVNSDILNLSERSFVIWSKATKGNYYQYLWTLTDDSNYHYGLAIFSNDGYLYTYDQEHGVGQTSCDVATGEWQCIVMTDDETHKRVYVNGVLKGTFAQVYDLNSSGKESMRLRIGNYLNGVNYHQGSLALFRVSGTILSPEQIAKIYNDEKHLFQTGAQATLYGTSDAVTALAHDDSTDLLHVGTSAGRSVFQGLRRVENTTTAVGTTISASNGLVAED